MIVLRVCGCGRSHEASAWSGLFPVARGLDDGVEVQRRRCHCGRILTVSVLEDDTARAIDEARYEARNAYGRARLECAMLRAARAGNFERRWGSFVLVRAEARAARARARQCEDLLAGIYRARELRAPLKRLGRNLAVVGGDVDPCADTERPPATGAR